MYVCVYICVYVYGDPRYPPKQGYVPWRLHVEAQFPMRTAISRGRWHSRAPTYFERRSLNTLKGEVTWRVMGLI